MFGNDAFASSLLPFLFNFVIQCYILKQLSMGFGGDVICSRLLLFWPLEGALYLKMNRLRNTVKSRGVPEEKSAFGFNVVELTADKVK